MWHQHRKFAYMICDKSVKEVFFFLSPLPHHAFFHPLFLSYPTFLSHRDCRCCSFQAHLDFPFPLLRPHQRHLRTVVDEDDDTRVLGVEENGFITVSVVVAYMGGGWSRAQRIGMRRQRRQWRRRPTTCRQQRRTSQQSRGPFVVVVFHRKAVVYGGGVTGDEEVRGDELGPRNVNV